MPEPHRAKSSKSKSSGNVFCFLRRPVSLKSSQRICTWTRSLLGIVWSPQSFHVTDNAGWGKRRFTVVCETQSFFLCYLLLDYFSYELWTYFCPTTYLLSTYPLPNTVLKQFVCTGHLTPVLVLRGKRCWILHLLTTWVQHREVKPPAEETTANDWWSQDTDPGGSAPTPRPYRYLLINYLKTDLLRGSCTCN